MESLCCQFLAGSTLTQQQNRAINGSYPGEPILEIEEDF
jgi:hypothetical protein